MRQSKIQFVCGCTDDPHHEKIQTKKFAKEVVRGTMYYAMFHSNLHEKFNFYFNVIFMRNGAIF